MTRQAEPIRNILFVMCDQLRFDYLGCAGHPHIKTPHIDALAKRGVRFSRAYVQSPVCGSSRMSFYTGRYVASHGATYNGIPLKVGELTMGDYLRPLGRDCVLVGKTHMKADDEGMARLGIEKQSLIGVRVSECGFDPFDRDDGLHSVGPDGRYDPKLPRYEEYLREKGYAGAYPWQDFANGVATDGNSIGNGFIMRHAREPARVAEEDSETPYMTRRAMEFITGAGDQPWVLHLSYIKPHWPYIAPAPYHAMYGPGDILPVHRDARERANAHPVYQAFMDLLIGRNFSREDVREAVIPAYMGLISQIDTELGRLFAFLDAQGLSESTMIVFTSDHGDYLGDHWLGEKDLFHEQSVKIPLVICDPRPSADATRGTLNDALVEAIDLLPTFIDAVGGDARLEHHRLDGHSLMPLIEGRARSVRDHVISEYDYGLQSVARDLGIAPIDARLFMLFDGRWKYVHAPPFRPMLFDLAGDPDEFIDLGADPAYDAERARLHRLLSDWAMQRRQRTTRSDPAILGARSGSGRRGILIGVYDESDVSAELWTRPPAPT